MLRAANGSERGLRLIALYKLGKAAIELALAAAVITLLLSGKASQFRAHAQAAEDHAVGAWSVYAATALVAATAQRNMEIAGAALVLDGLLTFIEGWALRRRKLWGPWLVVVATSSLLPFELLELVRHARVGRLLMLAVNIVIVVYLVRHALRGTSRRASSREKPAEPGGAEAQD